MDRKLVVCKDNEDAKYKFHKFTSNWREIVEADFRRLKVCTYDSEILFVGIKTYEDWYKVCAIPFSNIEITHSEIDPKALMAVLTRLRYIPERN